jgi:hypothetical protein
MADDAVPEHILRLLELDETPAARTAFEARLDKIREDRLKREAELAEPAKEFDPEDVPDISRSRYTLSAADVEREQIVRRLDVIDAYNRCQPRGPAHAATGS